MTDVRARAGHAVTGGASWRLTPWLRVMGNAGLEWFTEPRSAPEPPRTGAYPVMATRLQIGFP